MNQQEIKLSPASHRDDPASSFIAEAEAPIKGQALEVLNALKKYPNSTPRELARDSGLDYYKIQRRLSVLKNSHAAYSYIIRTCKVSGNQCGVWNPL